MKLVGLVNSLIHPSYRYRLAAFEDVLKTKGGELSVHALPRRWPGRLILLRRLKYADVMFLQRRLLSRVELSILRRSSPRLVYDFDDAVFYRSSNSPKGPRSLRRKSRFAATVRAADAVIAGNGFLAEFAARYTSPDKVHTIPTCVDPAPYDRCRRDNSREGTDLVWVGSRSTLPSILRIPEHFEALSRAVPEIRLKIICDVFPESLPIQIVPHHWSEQTEVQAVVSADIGISWMPDDPWSQGKCGLKVLQYMAAGLPVVANPVGVHREIVGSGETGFLVETPEQWSQAVEMLARDSKLRYSMGVAGRAKVIRDYSPIRWASEVIRVISGHTQRGTG